MDNLSLQTLCEGIMRVRQNASALLEDARLLRRNNRIPRAYATAYMACEEAGKLSILIGAATRVVIDVPVDWKSTRKRFRSHDSKASQFMGLARGIPVIQEAVAAKGQVVDSKLMLAKAAAGAVVGPTLFTNRNASLYCDFLDGSFTSPNEQISEEMADQMIECAELHIDVANVTLGATAEEAAKRITERWSRQRYDSMMSQVSETADLMQMALSMLHTP